MRRDIVRRLGALAKLGNDIRNPIIRRNLYVCSAKEGQEDVGQKGANDSALGRTLVGDREYPLLEYPSVEPFADQSQDHTIAHPSLEKLP